MNMFEQARSSRIVSEYVRTFGFDVVEVEHEARQCGETITDLTPKQLYKFARSCYRAELRDIENDMMENAY